jgi:hypothetical protein
MASRDNYFETVKDFMVKVSKEHRERFESQIQLDEVEIYKCVGKTIGRAVNVECYFPTAVRTRKMIALSSKMTGDCLFSCCFFWVFLTS